MSKLGIGILGAAGIAPAAVIRPARRHPDVEVVAVASRGGAQEYAARHAIAHAYGSYEKLLAAPEVDLVYVALPPSEHLRWAVAALEAGKDVLVEKPVTLDAAQARELRAAAERTGRRVVEAFHDSYHPLQTWVRQFLSAGTLGTVQEVTVVFNGATPYDPKSLRHDPALGGGALMDLGCYPVHWIRSFFGVPEVVSASADLNPLGADLSIEVRLRVGEDVPVTLRASMAEGVDLESSLRVRGTAGELHVDNLVFPVQGHTITLTRDGLSSQSTVAGRDTYDHQLEAVVVGLREGTALPTEGEDYVANMAVIDAAYAAAGVRPAALERIDG